MVQQMKIGDNIALFCEETSGYVFNLCTSSVAKELFIFHQQSRSDPEDIIDPQIIKFQLCIQNRYKLNKKYRKIYSSIDLDNVDAEIHLHAAQAKAAAEAENNDNTAEQERNNGRPVRYGDVVQLKHIFSNKYIHVNSSETSSIDKNNLKVGLEVFNDKSAQFKIMPRYKIKSEGEIILYGDQVAFESVKSPDHYFHSCSRVEEKWDFKCAEMNLGVDISAYSVVYLNDFVNAGEISVRGGQLIQLFHKELEAFVTAEGSPQDGVIEDVHLRIREVDNLNPRSLRPPTNANTYWQIEDEKSRTSGDPLSYETQIRFRHVVTRKYLAIDEVGQISLIDEDKDPSTVFQVHPVTALSENISFDSYVHLEHVISGQWLRAKQDQVYKREQDKIADESKSSLQAIKWDGGDLRKISASYKQQYEDVFTIQLVLKDKVTDFNYVAGLLPYYRTRLLQVKSGSLPSVREGTLFCVGLTDLYQFLLEDVKRRKTRQKLMRNLRLLDLIVEYTQHYSRLMVGKARTHLRVLKECYQVIYAYMQGNSRKNALYFAKYIDIFLPQMEQKSEIGLKAVEIVIELVRNNRKVVDRISHAQINRFIELVRQRQHSSYLELLHVLCVCNDVAITDNQNYIAEKWLIEDQNGVYFTEVGENIGQENGVLYVSIDKMRSWIPMKEFVNPSSRNYSQEKSNFFQQQLALFDSLCHNRNQYVIEIITKRMALLSWKEVFSATKTENLHEDLRARYCQLITSLFIDVGCNFSVISSPRLCFPYRDITGRAEEIKMFDEYNMPEDLEDFPSLKEWIAQFLSDNQVLVASKPSKNRLIEAVLRLLNRLVQFGYYRDVKALNALLIPVVGLVDGSTDVPFPPDKGEGFSREKRKAVARFRATERFRANKQNSILLEAKLAALDVLHSLATFETNVRLETFITKFKECQTDGTLYDYLPPKQRKKLKKTCLTPAMGEDFNAHSSKASDMALQKKMSKELRKLFEQCSFIRRDKLTPLLLDLAEYDSERANQKALLLLNTLFSVKEELFQLGLDALVLITEESNTVCEQVSQLIPQIQSILKTKWTSEQAESLERIFEQLKGHCSCSSSGEPHPMIQRILTSSNILNVVFQVLTVETDTQLSNKYVGVERVFRSAMEFLRVITHNNQDLQFKIFDRIDEILTVNFVDSDLALTLIQVFGNNMSICLRVTPRHVQKIMAHLADSNVRAPELVDLLLTIAKVNDLPLKRNQQLIIKYLMQNFSTVANGLERSQAERMRILKGKEGVEQQRYFLKLLELLAVCNEGENRFIESLSQNIISEEEAIEAITDPEVPFFALSYVIRFFCSVYLGRDLTDEKYVNSAEPGDNQSTMVPEEPQLLEIDQMRQTWCFFERIAEECAFVISSTNERRGMDSVEKVAEQPFNLCEPYDSEDAEQRLHSFLFCNISALCSFLKLFFKQNFASTISCDEEKETLILQRLTRNYCEAMSKVLPFCKKSTTLKEVIESSSALHHNSYLPANILEQVTECAASRSMQQIFDDMDMMEDMCQQGEVELNLKLKTFTINCSLLYVGHNTVKAQLRTGHSKREYTSVGGMDALPLGEEFQQHISCFVKSGHQRVETKYKQCDKLIRQLEVSAHSNYTSSVMFGSSGAVRKEQETLDIRCLQILRAIIHNEERQLPADWPTRTAETPIKNALKTIEKIQSFLASLEACNKILPHLANPKDRMLKEVLSLQASLLFNANRVSQQTLIDYFYGTREEVFFYAVRLRMQTSADILKEQRSLKEQRAARKKMQAKAMRSEAAGAGAQALRLIGRQQNETRSINNTATVLTRRVNLAQVQSKSIRQSRMISNGGAGLNSNHNNNHNGNNNNNHNNHNSSGRRSKKSVCTDEDIKVDVGHQNAAYDTIDRDTALELKTVSGDGRKTALSHSLLGSEDDEEDELESGDDTVGLVLRVLAAVCDGQHHQLQNYLRSQPDNVKSFNLVAEVVQFLDVVYTNIDEYNIELVVEIFSTLNELSVGNRENRTTIYDSKVMDYINFILRAGNYPNIPLEKTLELWSSIAILLVSMIEENDPNSLVIASEVRETLDKESIYRIMYESFRLHTHSDVDSDLKETAEELGFQLYIILARLLDINPNAKLRHVTPEQSKAFRHYRKNSMSVELLKSGHVQKCHFRVKNKQMVREEVKEMVKWCLDRTSPSNKLRDFMEWSRVILKDSVYQRRLLRNAALRFITGYWLTWNYSILLLSLVICVMLLVGRVAPPGHAITIDTPVNNTVPLKFYTEPTDIWAKDFQYMKTVTFVLGIIHNVFSFLTCFTYFLANHPPMPKFQNLLQYFVPKKTDDEEEVIRTKQTNTKTTSAPFLSMSTLFYLAILGFSIAGSAYDVYFFSFHLLNIVNNNPTLQGVIKAITKNGVSLLLVALLGIIIIFFFSIIGFVFFRSGMAEDNLMFCDTLAKCFFTHIRFGIVGDLLENAIPHEGEQFFYRFVHFVIFHLTFYILITTIGLNLIFGIIVDTFSELRDLKWQAEADMRDMCFICSRANFEFEHTGRGFLYHVKEEHNMWSYVFFFIHLQETKLNDLTAIELHVQKLLDVDSSDFFPFNRAMCLATHDEDSGTSSTEQLLENVRKLHEFQVTELVEKRRQREIERQRRWRGQYGRRGGPGAGSSIASTLDVVESQDDILPSTRPLKRMSLHNVFPPIISPRGAKGPQSSDEAADDKSDRPPPAAQSSHSSSRASPPPSPAREVEDYEYPRQDPMRFLDDYDDRGEDRTTM